MVDVGAEGSATPQAPGAGEAREPGSQPSNDTTVHFTEEFASSLSAMEAGISPSERDAIAALPSGSALLIVRRGPNVGARFLLDSDRTTAGRHPDADIFLDDVTVSRRHVEFRRTARSFEVVDKNSLNGTYVNHDLVDSVELRSGSEVQIGKFRLTFYLSPARAAGRA